MGEDIAERLDVMPANFCVLVAQRHEESRPGLSGLRPEFLAAGSCAPV